ncbi:MAG: AI-2E family transporter, partial [Nannocystaceae bacterium]
MDRPRAAFQTLVAAAALVILVAGLQAAGEMVLPFLFAVLLAVISAPVVLWLERRRVPGWLAVVIVVFLVMGVLAIFGAVLAASVGEFSRAAPRYRERLDTSFAAAAAWLSSFDVELSLRHIEPGSWMDAIGTTLNGLLVALTNMALVILTMVFILLEITELPRKVQITARDPEAALGRVRRMSLEIQRYLVIKTLLSAATGLVLGIWTWALGIDFPLLWGVSAFLLNFVPNIGSIIAAVPPILVALVQRGSLYALLVAVGFVAVNMVIGNIIEPQWMGRRLGLSPLVVFLSLLFWGFVWGPVGMLLSVPLTMAIKISFEQSEEHRWIAVFLSGAPDLEEQRVRGLLP